MNPTETELQILLQLERLEKRIIEIQASIGSMNIIKTRAGRDGTR